MNDSKRNHSRLQSFVGFDFRNYHTCHICHAMCRLLCVTCNLLCVKSCVSNARCKMLRARCYTQDARCKTLRARNFEGFEAFCCTISNRCSSHCSHVRAPFLDMPRISPGQINRFRPRGTLLQTVKLTRHSKCLKMSEKSG